MTGRVGQLQRVETRRLARRQEIVAAARGADEHLGAPILVEEHDPRLEFARLGEQEVQHHRLAGAGGADDREIAEVAVVEVEEVGPDSGGLEQGHRIAPMIAADWPRRMVVQAGEAGEIGGGDQARVRLYI